MNDLSLLCETCGYPIQGLNPDHISSAESPAPARTPHCPECGTPIADSMPERRRGSPWQQRPGLAGWARTISAMIRRPTATFGDVIVRKGSRGLLAANVLLTSLLVAPPLTGVLAADPARAWRGRGPIPESLGWILSVLGLTLVVFACFQALTLVEFFGIRFFARRRRYRLTRDAAAQVCAHASVGWLAAGILPYLLAPAAIMLVRALGIGDKPIDFSPYLPFNMPVSDAAAFAGHALGLTGGMVAFESLVYFGVRRNRFANHADTPISAGTPQLTPSAANPVNS